MAVSASFKRRLWWSLAVFCGLALCWLGYQVLSRAATVHYITAMVERGDVESSVVAVGVVQPVTYVDVGAQTSGKLRSLKVQRGDQVVADQLLAEIDPVLALTALTAANAILENMTAQHAVKQAQLVLAGLQRLRNDNLFAQLQITADEHDMVQAAYAVAVAEVTALSAQMKQAAAAVETAKANVGYTRITAPMAGEIVAINLLEGQTLNANQQAPNILRIADLDTVTIWAQVSEADIFRVKVGQEVHFTVLGQTRVWHGRTRQILPTPELINNVVFYDVLCDIPNPEHDLRIQMTAQVFIVLAAAKQVLLIPIAALAARVGEIAATVRVMGVDGQPVQRAITIGIRSEIAAEVSAGLTEGEWVVIREVSDPVTSRSALNARRPP